MIQQLRVANGKDCSAEGRGGEMMTPLHVFLQHPSKLDSLDQIHNGANLHHPLSHKTQVPAAWTPVLWSFPLWSAMM